jgi:serine/threonine protein kinase
VRRDLKPENLFVTDAGDGSDRVKVLDFGIAQIRSPDRSRVTRTGAKSKSPPGSHAPIRQTHSLRRSVPIARSPMPGEQNLPRREWAIEAFP